MKVMSGPSIVQHTTTHQAVTDQNISIIVIWFTFSNLKIHCRKSNEFHPFSLSRLQQHINIRRIPKKLSSSDSEIQISKFIQVRGMRERERETREEMMIKSICVRSAAEYMSSSLTGSTYIFSLSISLCNNFYSSLQSPHIFQIGSQGDVISTHQYHRHHPYRLELQCCE